MTWGSLSWWAYFVGRPYKVTIIAGIIAGMKAKILLQPIKLGQLELPNRLVQGPLAGYSAAPFRVLAERHGRPGFCATEMISAKTLRHRQSGLKRYLYRDPEERRVCYQISGNNVDDIAYATEVVTQAGADLIDLNCGCPVKKIRARGCGTKLLETPDKIAKLVSVMKANTDAAVSIKIRVSTPNNDSDDIAVASAAEQAGADYIVVHGRHWTERYDVGCRLDDIARIVKAVTIPVFANGDVEDTASAIETMEQTGCDGLMICRASVGNPWLFQRILCELADKKFVAANVVQIKEAFIEHVERLCKIENEKLAVLQSRKLAKYYARDLVNRAEFVEQAQYAQTLKQLFQLLEKYFMDKVQA